MAHLEKMCEFYGIEPKFPGESETSASFKVPLKEYPKACYKINTGIFGLENLVHGKIVAKGKHRNDYTTEYHHQHRWPTSTTTGENK
jgi:hypothetical protein